ncbi:MAG TPA: hypothetical protein VLZ12_00990 [Verrucomicrobiae bacterium]|nr:hypothetical protein [Verrucomicrobiae bacterium]
MALVRAEKTEAFAEATWTAYCKETLLTPHIYACRAADGAELV